jgi:hypothetical protein
MMALTSASPLAAVKAAQTGATAAWNAAASTSVFSSIPRATSSSAMLVSRAAAIWRCMATASAATSRITA